MNISSLVRAWALLSSRSMILALEVDLSKRNERKIKGVDIEEAKRGRIRLVSSVLY